jgi:hypothetical protein
MAAIFIVSTNGNLDCWDLSMRQSVGATLRNMTSRFNSLLSFLFASPRPKNAGDAEGPSIMQSPPRLGMQPPVQGTASVASNDG